MGFGARSAGVAKVGARPASLVQYVRRREFAIGVPPKRGRKTTGLKSVGLRIQEDQRTLIDMAASIEGRSRSDFIIEASRRAAEDVILDQRVIMVSQECYDHFLAILDRPPEVSESLAKLFSTKAPSER